MSRSASPLVGMADERTLLTWRDDPSPLRATYPQRSRSHFSDPRSSATSTGVPLLAVRSRLELRPPSLRFSPSGDFSNATTVGTAAGPNRATAPATRILSSTSYGVLLARLLTA